MPPQDFFRFLWREICIDRIVKNRKKNGKNRAAFQIDQLKVDAENSVTVQPH